MMIIINGENLSYNEVVKVARNYEPVKIDSSCLSKIQKSREIVEELLVSNNDIYGINTGFGELSNTHINTDDVDQLQQNLIRSHACGVGKPLSTDVVRAMMLLRINSLIKGYSGIRLEAIHLLVEMLNSKIHPIVPQKGSIGASGDLIPLAHLGLAMIGEGDVEINGSVVGATTALEQHNLVALQLKAKEGLALINGTPFMTALACLGLYDAKQLLKNAQITGSMAVEALRGTNQAFREEIHRLRPHPGQKIIADNLWRLTQHSPIMQSHKNCEKVQDAYTLRCMPQVLGATYDVFTNFEHMLEIEINSVTDNPLIIPETREALSGGNFHGQPLAYHLDFLAIAVSEIGNILERQIARLVDTKESGLPPFLSNHSGLNSGYMIPHYAAAALLTENKILSHPASTDSIPTSANKEDHVSMGATAGLKAQTIIQNTKTIIAIHYLLATQALDFHKPLQSSPALQTVHDRIRKDIPTLKQDRYIQNDLTIIEHCISNNEFVLLAEEKIGLIN